MPILPILLTVEILSALFISSATPNTFSLRHSGGFPVILAQESPTPSPDQPPPDVAPPPDSSTPPPTDTPAQPAPAAAPSDQPSTTTPIDTTPTSTPPDPSQPTTTSNDSTLLNDINSQTQETPTETPPANPSPDQTNQLNDQSIQTNNSGQSSPQPFSVVVDNPGLTQASTTVLNSAGIVGGPAETVNEKTAAMAQKQDEKIAQAQSPTEVATMSIDFAKNSVKESENSIRSDDFSTTSFVTQRLSNQVDTALTQSQKAGSTKLANQLKSFCRQSDLLFRSQQLSVPEQSEQDFEIIRGKCLDIVK